MSKPRIWFEYGRYWCARFRGFYYANGATPLSAYNAWLEHMSYTHE